MTREQVKSYLGSYRRAVIRIENAEEMLLSVKDYALKQELGKEGKSVGNHADTVATAVERLEKLRIDKLYWECAKVAILMDVAKISDVELQGYILEHYVRGVSYTEIAEKNYISERQLFRRLNKAYDELGALIDNEFSELLIA